jgi:hypothetical protein
MFRKLILSAVLATGAVAGVTTTAATADAAPFEHRREFHHRFEVIVQCGRGWENRGTFGDRFEAERRAQHLRHEGFRVEIREF